MRITIRNQNAKTARGIRRGVFRLLGNAAAFVSDETARKSRDDIQVAMAGAGLGKLAKVVRYSSDLKKRRTPRVSGDGAPVQPWRAGAIVFATGGSDRTSGAFQAYSQGAVMAPKGGRRWLAFPTKAIPKRVGRLKMTPALYNSSGLASSIGPLQFVKGISANVAYLVAKNVSVSRITGTGAKRPGKRGGAGGAGRQVRPFVVAFILIRTTSRFKRFDPQAIVQRRFKEMPRRMKQYVEGNMRSETLRGPALFSLQGRGSGALIPITRAGV